MEDQKNNYEEFRELLRSLKYETLGAAMPSNFLFRRVAPPSLGEFSLRHVMDTWIQSRADVSGLSVAGWVVEVRDGEWSYRPPAWSPANASQPGWRPHQNRKIYMTEADATGAIMQLRSSSVGKAYRARPVYYMGIEAWRLYNISRVVSE
jgi:hypothetical protein